MLLTGSSPTCGGLGGESLFRGRYESGEALLIVDRDVREDLAIDLDLRERKSVHQAAVREAARACRSVDARNPQRAELALAHSAVAERVLAGLDDRLFRGAISLAPRVVVTLRLIEDLAMACFGGDATFYSGHLSLLKRTATGGADPRRRSRRSASCGPVGVSASGISWSGCGACANGRL